jgi:hypothetical protein
MPSAPTEDYTDVFSFINGFVANVNLLSQVPAIILDGQNVWVRGHDNLISDMGPAAGSPIGGAIGPAMVSKNQLAGLVGGGVVTDHDGIPWFEGPSGPAFLGNTNLGVSNGILMLVVGGVATPAGLAKPGPPLIDLLGPPSVKIKGSYSISVEAYRQSTGAVSTRSDFSNVVLGKNTQLRIIQPGSLDPGATHVLPCATLRGFGSIGPMFRITTIPPIPRAQYLNAAAVPINLEFYDGDLGDLAFLANDPPLPGTACVSMGATLVDLGVIGGYGISPSNLGFSEAFDVTKISFLAAKEAITGVIPYSAEGIVYVSTANSLNVLVLTGSSTIPVLPRGLWPSTGFSGPNSFCLAGHTIYGMSGQRGPVRTQGSLAPDWSFALPVITDMQAHGATSANTVVVYCPDQGAVVYASGSLAWPLMLDTEKWSTRITLPGTVTAGTTVGNQGTFLVGSATYVLNAGNGAGVQFMLQSEFHRGRPHHPMYGNAHYENLKWTRRLHVAASDPMTYSIIKDMSQTPVSPLFPWTAPAGGHQLMSPQACGKCRSYALKITGTGGGQQFRSAQMGLEIEPSDM